PAQSCRIASRGIALADWTPGGYATPACGDAIDALAATGANTMIIVVTAYQPAASSSVPREDAARTPEHSAVRARAGPAPQDGLAVVVKPHVDVDDGTWRGRIAPPDPAAWFDAYRHFVVGWAAFADSLGSPEFVVGTELASTLASSGEWQRTIAAVRQVFHGQISYAASCDEAERVPLWRDVDRAGVDFHCRVAQWADAGGVERLAGWQPCLDRLPILQAKIDRPMFLAEIGYRSVDGAALRPWDAALAGGIDVEEQADLYWA